MEFNLKVTDKDIEVIGAALAELPFKTVSDLVMRLQLQINEQNTPVAEPVEAPAAKAKK